MGCAERLNLDLSSGAGIDDECVRWHRVTRTCPLEVWRWEWTGGLRGEGEWTYTPKHMYPPPSYIHNTHVPTHSCVYLRRKCSTILSHVTSLRVRWRCFSPQRNGDFTSLEYSIFVGGNKNIVTQDIFMGSMSGGGLECGSTSSKENFENKLI